MKLQNLTIIFIIIILPVVLVLSSYIGYEIKTINKQNMYNTGVMQATHDAVFSFEMNTKNDAYSNNAENKRSNIKAAVKTFENSLSTTCNLGLYNNEAIEEYIPAIVFGLYDGFYMYAPSELTKEDGTSTYKHNLRNYVYYSERIKYKNEFDIVIRYTLDNYIAVSGTIDKNRKYVTKAGYLINLLYDNNKYALISYELQDGYAYNDAKIIQKESLQYYENFTSIKTEESESAKKYYEEALKFSYWFNSNIVAQIDKQDRNTAKYSYLNILINDQEHDPDYENSLFVQHKRQIMKEKIQSVLNSSITAYAKRTGTDYKMPKFSEEEWERVYNNISVIAFVQGMDLGFKKYNNYCVLSSTNNQEYVNPNLIYFVDEKGYYHDIRCEQCTSATTLTGYKIGDFEKIKYEAIDPSGNSSTKYYYKHPEYACYSCINGTPSTTQSIYEYVRSTTDSEIKNAYFTALARERYNTTKLLSNYNK